MTQEKEALGIEETIKKTVQELIKAMGIQAEVSMEKIFQEDKEDLVCEIKTEDSNYLIGQYGVNLQALQHIARVLTRKKVEDRVNFILDVNSYRKEKNDSVMLLAKDMADKAVLEKRSIILRPMSPYERRLVHMELSGDERVETESVGEGEDRRVAIKPAGLA